MPFGILPSEDVHVGDHIAYFWESNREFDQAVSFLVTGIAQRDHCVIFGHDQANRRVGEVLLARGLDVAALEATGQLTIAGSETTGDETLAKLGSVFAKALEGGASMIRLLGNIGWGKAGWPAEDDLLLFEAKVTGAARAFPSVIVCMYDVRTLSGRVIVNGGFGTHGITVCGNVMRVNTHHVDADQTASRIRDTSALRSTNP